MFSHINTIINRYTKIAVGIPIHYNNKEVKYSLNSLMPGSNKRVKSDGIPRC